MIICLELVVPISSLGSVQMAEGHWADSRATSVTHLTLEALGECLQSWMLYFYLYLKSNAYLK